MAFPTIADCTVETSTTTGTGPFTLAGAIVGYQNFDSWCSVGGQVYYMIEAIDGSGNRAGDWEVGIGTYSATNTLTRTTFLDGSSWPTFCNFAAGTKRVSIVTPAQIFGPRGALVYKSADQNTANYTTATAITFDSETYDYNGTAGGVFHDTVTNSSRLTVPSVGVGQVRLRGHVAISNFVGSQWYALYIYKNGSNSYVGSPGLVSYNNITTAEIEVATPLLDVAPGDYFELVLQVGSDTSISVLANRTWFELEVVR